MAVRWKLYYTMQLETVRIHIVTQFGQAWLALGKSCLPSVCVWKWIPRAHCDFIGESGCLIVPQALLPALRFLCQKPTYSSFAIVSASSLSTFSLPVFPLLLCAVVFQLVQFPAQIRGPLNKLSFFFSLQEDDFILIFSKYTSENNKQSTACLSKHLLDHECYHFMISLVLSSELHSSPLLLVNSRSSRHYPWLVLVGNK